MLVWLAAALVLFVLQTLVPNSLRYFGGDGPLGASLRAALGPRDATPRASVLADRAARALANLHEAMVVFVPLALVAHAQHADDAKLGAAIFVLARVAYVPAYLSGVPGVRSTAWVVSWVGLAMMIAALSWG